MSFQFDKFEGVAGIEPERALNIGVGAAQAPLWAAFYASVGLGAAWWWSTAWTRALPAFRLDAEAASDAMILSAAPLMEAAVDLVEAAQAEAEEALEAVEPVQTAALEQTPAVAEVAEEIAAGPVGAAETLVEASADTIEALTDASAEALVFAADAEAPVAEPVTLEPTSQARALAEAIETPTPKARKKARSAE